MEHAAVVPLVRGICPNCGCDGGVEKSYVVAAEGSSVVKFSGPLAKPYLALFPDGCPIPLFNPSADTLRQWWERVKEDWPGFELHIAYEPDPDIYENMIQVLKFAAVMLAQGMDVRDEERLECEVRCVLARVFGVNPVGEEVLPLCDLP
jgi:hypothetical protein